MDLELYSLEELKEELARREAEQTERKVFLDKINDQEFSDKQKIEIFDKLHKYFLVDIKDHLDINRDSSDDTQYAWEECYTTFFGKDVFDIINEFTS